MIFIFLDLVTEFRITKKEPNAQKQWLACSYDADTPKVKLRL